MNLAISLNSQLLTQSLFLSSLTPLHDIYRTPVPLKPKLYILLNQADVDPIRPILSPPANPGELARLKKDDNYVRCVKATGRLAELLRAVPKAKVGRYLTLSKPSISKSNTL